MFMPPVIAPFSRYRLVERGILYAGPETVYNVELRQMRHVDVDQKGQIIDPNIVYREHVSQRGPLVTDAELPTIKYGDIKTAIGQDRILQRSTFWAVIAEKPK